MGAAELWPESPIAGETPSKCPEHGRAQYMPFASHDDLPGSPDRTRALATPAAESMTPRQRSAIGAFVALFVALLALDCALDFEPTKLGALFALVAWMPLRAFHVLAHAIAARACGWQVCEMVLGLGARVVRFSISGVRCDLRLLPLDGYVLASPRSLALARLRSALIASAGPLADFAIVAIVVLAVGTDRLFARSEDPALLVLQAIAFAAFLGALVALIPWSVTTRHGVARSDGLRVAAGFAAPMRSFEELQSLPGILRIEELERGGNWQEAVDLCETALERHPHNLSLRLCLVRALPELGRFLDARAVVRSLAADGSFPARTLAILEQLVVLLDLMTGDDDLEAEAESLARRGLDAAPDDALWLALWGVVQSVRYRLPEGRLNIDRARERARSGGARRACVALRALAELRLGNVDSARALLGDLERSTKRECIVDWIRGELRRAPSC